MCKISKGLSDVKEEEEWKQPTALFEAMECDPFPRSSAFRRGWTAHSAVINISPNGPLCPARSIACLSQLPSAQPALVAAAGVCIVAWPARPRVGSGTAAVALTLSGPAPGTRGSGRASF